MSQSIYNYNAKIVRVIDGDTIEAMIDLGFNVSIKVPVRLYGIDTPETRTLNAEEKKAGLVSKERLKALLPEGKSFYLTSKKIEKYGRILGDIKLTQDSELTVSQTLIKEGLAKEYYGEKKS